MDLHYRNSGRHYVGNGGFHAVVSEIFPAKRRASFLARILSDRDSSCAVRMEFVRRTTLFVKKERKNNDSNTTWYEAKFVS
mmetsp:Transcript_28115/g.65372  ORF Transcript_28115/g.65372 Transcript_28115/m.65372 type:complete len:81 (-) Transcript_28115:487-729(-)